MKTHTLTYVELKDVLSEEDYNVLLNAFAEGGFFAEQGDEEHPLGSFHYARHFVSTADAFLDGNESRRDRILERLNEATKVALYINLRLFDN